MKSALRYANKFALVAASCALSAMPYCSAQTDNASNSSAAITYGWEEVDAHKSQIAAQIAAATSAKRLSSQDAANIKAQLDAIAQSEKHLRESGKNLSYTESFLLSNQLNGLSATLEQLLEQHSQSPTTADLSARQSKLLKQIETAERAGQISTKDTRELRRQLTRVTEIENAFKASNEGPFTAKQAQILSQDLDKIDNELMTYLSGKESASQTVDALQAQMEKRVNDSIRAGRLSQNDGASFKRDLQRIAVLELSYKDSYGGLNRQEILTLLGELDQLNSRIDQQIQARAMSMPDIDAMHAKLTKAIAEGAASGKLSGPDAEELRKDLESIASLESSYKASGGGLSPAEAQALALRLEQLSSRIESQNTAVAVANDINRREADLRKKIVDGLSAGTLSQRESDRFLAELDDIQDEETSFRYDDGSLSDEDRITLSGDLDRMNIRLNQLLRIRRNQTPDIASKMNRLLNRINDGVANGKLTPLEASLLRMEYNRIVKLERAYKTSHGSLSMGETARLSSDLDKLDMLISQEVNNRNTVPRTQ
jgi:hypothetical protein